MKSLFILPLLALSLGFFGCEKLTKTIDNMSDMPDITRDMRTTTKGMRAETAENMRLMKVAEAKKGLENPDNGRVLSPIPFKLIPWAKVFAEHATLSELADQTYIYIKEANEGLPGKLIDASGNETDWTLAEVNEINRSKMQMLLATQAIAGLLPQEKVEALIQDQIMQQGRQYYTVMALLMMRVQFLRDVLLESSLLSEPLDTVGKLEKALEYAQQIDYVLSLPFVGAIKMKVTGFQPPLENFEEGLDASSARELAVSTYSKIKDKAERQLQVSVTQLTNSPANDQALYQEALVRKDKALAKIDERLAAWTARNP